MHLANIRLIIITSLIALLVGCSDAPDVFPKSNQPPAAEPEPTPPPVTVDLGGGGVKGPMAQADANLYQIDVTAANLQGELVASGSTDNSAKFQNLTVTEPQGPYLLVISANQNTFDITTNNAPVINTLMTLVDDDQLTGASDIYATPLSTMALILAQQVGDTLATGNQDGALSTQEFLDAANPAALSITSTLGFGIDENTNIFTTPPLLSSNSNDLDGQLNSVAYRQAIEATAAIIYQMVELQGDSGVTTDQVMQDLALDLADGAIDGVINGEQADSYPQASLELFEQDPSTLPIPGDDSGKTVADVKKVVLDETAVTGAIVETQELASDDTVVSIQVAQTSPDIDGDGVLNSQDDFPNDATADTDSDGDGLPDVAYFLDDAGLRTAQVNVGMSDPDDDNDGVEDSADAFPLDPNESVDTDNDGVGNNADTDDDGDGVADSEDDFPLDPNASDATDVDGDGWPAGQDPDDNDANNPGSQTPFVDTDGDGIGNNTDTDDDGDGVSDEKDAFPLDATEQTDTDKDGIGDKTDTDIDGDGVANGLDAFPYNANESLDTDGDGVGNNRDEDDDNDSLSDAFELSIGTDPLDIDSDDDGALDGADALPLDPNSRFDSDKDGIGNNVDNCPLVANPSQADTDNDGFGDVCDSDDDADGVADAEDAFPLNAAESADFDGDGIGNNADTDDDNDGVQDSDDAFPFDASEFLDTDNDGVGNNADSDDDGDGVADSDDDFPLDANASDATDVDSDGWPAGQDPDDNDASNPGSQTPFVDTDGDGIGNTTDSDDDGDGVLDVNDAFPLDAAEAIDTDNDGIGDNADSDLDGDGVNNSEDKFPFDSAESSDQDADGIGDNSDADRDGDGVNNEQDAFPDNATETLDSDNDGIGNNSDPDIDGDGVNNDADALPFNPLETIDSDKDGVGNNADSDDDNDGLADSLEATIGSNPLNPDTDGDGVFDGGDNCVLQANSDQADDDANGVGNVCETDSDSDGVADSVDNCPLVANADQADFDNDFVGNVCDSDDDNDGVADDQDALPLDGSETLDTDNDGIGNNSDTDDDGDGVNDSDDAFPLDGSETLDTDNDGIGNNSDTDDDGDGVNDSDDAFPLDGSETLDTDNDGIGNNSDTDDDGDGVNDSDDAFPLDGSETLDTDNDGIGNNSDTDDDGDGVNDSDDAFPLDGSETLDTDNDGVGDNADTVYNPTLLPAKVVHLPALTHVDTVNVVATDVYVNLFNSDGSGSETSSWGTSNYQWQFTPEGYVEFSKVDDSTYERSMDAQELVDTLLQQQLISEEQAQQYLALAVDGFVTIEVTSFAKHIVAYGTPVDGIGKAQMLQIFDFWYMPEAFGDAVYQVQTDNFIGEFVWFDAASFTGLALTEESIAQGSWAITAFVDDGDPSMPWTMYGSALLDFLADGSISVLSEEADATGVTWSLQNNQLTIAADFFTQTTMLVEQDGAIYGAYTETVSQGQTYYSYHYMAMQDATVDLSVIDDRFLQNSWSIIDRSLYNEQDYNLSAIWGFIKPSQGPAQRVMGGCEQWGQWPSCDEGAHIFSDPIDFSIVDGRIYWYQKVELNNDGSINWDSIGSDCDLADNDCSIWQRREWIPLVWQDDRLFVIESLQTDYHDGQGFINTILHRTVFYQAFAAGIDLDKDGFLEDDQFPFDTKEWLDTDGDGIGNNADMDDDNDGVNDDEDALPLDPEETLDTDNDGIGNNSDDDDDNDGVLDEQDMAPLDDRFALA
ncbi:thrombospondin type 3 repeat-containing protein, partial [Paraferrimonas sp. SM1919]|uniref:thrombospondin type 3 repeat-containing protein n=1 Tax=Paraferrimonas sp. SM1919 TaxID=2662263 RepID=UPI001F09A14F